MSEGAESSGCKVYVGNLAWTVSWQDLKDTFREVGEVKYADVFRDRNRRSRGCGVVEFETPELARAAVVAKHDTDLKGRPIVVREYREGPENQAKPKPAAAPAAAPAPRAPRAPRPAAAAPAAAAAAAPATGEPGRRVYVGNLAWSVAWQDLKDLFKQCGNVQYADVMHSGDGRSKGCGIVEFSTAEEAQRAIADLNDYELKGRQIFVREDREPGRRGRAAEGTA